MTERDDSTYHDHEFDHTPEEVASDLPPGHGSNTYTEEELDAIDYWESLGKDRCPKCGLSYADDNDTTHECPPGFIDVPPRLPEDGDIDSLPKITEADFELMTREVWGEGMRIASRLAGPSGAGPTDCMNPECGKEDGRTRAGGTHCHDCMEDLVCP